MVTQNCLLNFNTDIAQCEKKLKTRNWVCFVQQQTNLLLVPLPDMKNFPLNKEKIDYSIEKMLPYSFDLTCAVCA